jgi:hypothetical protein
MKRIYYLERQAPPVLTKQHCGRNWSGGKSGSGRSCLPWRVSCSDAEFLFAALFAEMYPLLSLLCIIHRRLQFYMMAITLSQSFYSSLKLIDIILAMPRIAMDNLKKKFYAVAFDKINENDQLSMEAAFIELSTPIRLLGS